VFHLLLTLFLHGTPLPVIHPNILIYITLSYSLNIFYNKIEMVLIDREGCSETEKQKWQHQ
jgi:hypothetical protein